MSTLYRRLYNSFCNQLNTVITAVGWAGHYLSIQTYTTLWLPICGATEKHLLIYTHTCMRMRTRTRTHTHTFIGTRKVKPIWILLKQETVDGSGISWAMCKAAPYSRQTTTPAPHHSYVFLQAGCPSCRPTNSVKALKAYLLTLVRMHPGPS